MDERSIAVQKILALRQQRQRVAPPPRPRRTLKPPVPGSKEAERRAAQRALREEVREYFQQGLRPKQILKQMAGRLCLSIIHRVGRELGIRYTASPPRPRHPKKEQALTLLQAGTGTKEVARAIGVHASTVRRWRHQVRAPIALNTYPRNNPPRYPAARHRLRRAAGSGG